MTEPLSKADVLDKLAFEAQWQRNYASDLAAAGLDAIAAWLAAACVVPGGHRRELRTLRCTVCGERREEMAT